MFRRCVGRSVTSRPSTSSRPESGDRLPVIRRSSVVFPHPDRRPPRGTAVPSWLVRRLAPGWPRYARACRHGERAAHPVGAAGGRCHVRAGVRAARRTPRRVTAGCSPSSGAPRSSAANSWPYVPRRSPTGRCDDTPAAAGSVRLSWQLETRRARLGAHAGRPRAARAVDQVPRWAGSVLLFGALALVAAVLHPRWSVSWIWVIVDAGLLLIALVSLVLRHPLTLQYARERVSHDLWETRRSWRSTCRSRWFGRRPSG